MSGIIYTPKEPKTKAAQSRITDEARQRRSDGGKRADRRTTAEVRQKRSLQKFLNDNPLENRDEFYIRFQDPRVEHLRHYIADQLFVSIDGENWFEVDDIVKKIEGSKDA